MKKLAIILLFICALGFVGYRAYEIYNPGGGIVSEASPVATAPAVAPAKTTSSLRMLDVDAMAARMKKNQDVYQRLRDQSLKIYRQAHPNPEPYEDVAQMLIRLSAYLYVWDDFYQEGLWKTYEDNFKQGLPPNYNDDIAPLLFTAQMVGKYKGRYAMDNQVIDYVLERADRMSRTDYPAEFKLWTYEPALSLTVSASRHPEIKDAVAISVSKLPMMTKKAAGYYRELIKQHHPDDMLVAKGAALVNVVEDNTETLVAMGREIDDAFAAEAPESPARIAVHGRYLTDYAWNARGGGWARDVTEEKWRLFNERLLEAGVAMETGYRKFPNFSGISDVMIRVELGEGKGRDRMEEWFDRAMKANPDDFKACSAKAVYLYPRWHGSPTELWDFGIWCVNTGNYEARLPLILLEAVGEYSDQPGFIFSVPSVWDPLQKMLKEYLRRYPESTIIRSKYVKYAAMGRHWDVVKEQAALLGDEWDRDVFDGVNYAAIKQMADDQTKGH